MKKKEFDNLLQKFENGDCTPEEIIFLEGVVNESIVTHSELSIFKDENEMQSEEGRMWNKLNVALFNKSKIRNFNKHNRWVPITIAACLLLVVSFSIYLYFPEFFRSNVISDRGMETQNNANTNRQRYLHRQHSRAADIVSSQSCACAQGIGHQQWIFKAGRWHFGKRNWAWH